MDEISLLSFLKIMHAILFDYRLVLKMSWENRTMRIALNVYGLPAMPVLIVDEIAATNL